MEKYRSFTGVLAAMTLMAIGAGCSLGENEGDMGTAEQASAKSADNTTEPCPCPVGQHEECTLLDNNAAADTQTPPVCVCVPDVPPCPCPEGQHEECSLVANATADTQQPPVCQCLPNAPPCACDDGEHEECTAAPDACTPPACECVPDVPPCPREQREE